jgi:hypothetical protein
MHNSSKILSPTALLASVLLAAAVLPGAAEASGSARAQRAGGPTLVADYQFNGDLKSSVKGAPRLRNIGHGNVFHRENVPGEGRTKVLRFPLGNGLKANTKGLIPSKHYSVVVQFRFNVTGTQGYARLLNPTLPADDNDNGLYVYDDYLTWYDGGSNDGTAGTISPNTYVEVAFTRNANGKVRAYVNGEPDITYADADKQAVIQNHVLRFFKDNSNDEEAKGAVSRIRLYDDALSAKRVHAIYAKGH